MTSPYAAAALADVRRQRAFAERLRVPPADPKFGEAPAPEAKTTARPVAALPTPEGSMLPQGHPGAAVGPPSSAALVQGRPESELPQRSSTVEGLQGSSPVEADGRAAEGGAKNPPGRFRIRDFGGWIADNYPELTRHPTLPRRTLQELQQQYAQYAGIQKALLAARVSTANNRQAAIGRRVRQAEQNDVLLKRVQRGAVLEALEGKREGPMTRAYAAIKGRSAGGRGAGGGGPNKQTWNYMMGPEGSDEGGVTRLMDDDPAQWVFESRRFAISEPLMEPEDRDRIREVLRRKLPAPERLFQADIDPKLKGEALRMALTPEESLRLILTAENEGWISSEAKAVLLRHAVPQEMLQEELRRSELRRKLSEAQPGEAAGPSAEPPTAGGYGETFENYGALGLAARGASDLPPAVARGGYAAAQAAAQGVKEGVGFGSRAIMGRRPTEAVSRFLENRPSRVVSPRFPEGVPTGAARPASGGLPPADMVQFRRPDGGMVFLPKRALTREAIARLLANGYTLPME